MLSAIGILVLAGCGNDENPQPAGTTTNQTTNEAAAMPGGSTRPKIVESSKTESALLTDVQVGHHPSFDRVVFEFRNTLPGYDVRYVGRPYHQDPSDRVLKVAGRYLLQVVMHIASDADLSRGSVSRTYTGPNRLEPHMPQIAEVVGAGGFEGVLTWLVGLNHRTAFRVNELDHPPRLVVDAQLP